MILIGLHGKAGAGKDTVAEILTRWVGIPLIDVIAFADPIRAALQAMFDDHVCLHGPGKEQVIPGLLRSTRYLLQTLGTEWGRQLVQPDLWILLAAQQVEQARHQQRTECCVITDVRFPNEADWIRGAGGHIWHIERDVPPVEEHASENGIERLDEDVIVRNHGSLNDLEPAVWFAYGQSLSREYTGAAAWPLPGIN